MVIDMAGIDVDGISFSYEKREILEDISFSAKDGNFLSIIGPSGCGKSTILRIIAGLLKPNSGQILYSGKSYAAAQPKISFVFQEFALLPWLTNLENVLIGLSASEMTEREKRGKAERYLNTFGLSNFADFYPNSLSGGMKQRVGLARAVVSEPDILLMDEPFSSLDFLTASALRANVREMLNDKSIPVSLVIMVTHNVEEAVELSNSIVVLSESPAKVRSIVDVDLPFPRVKSSAKFRKSVDAIYSLLTS